jgi:MtN3 and saliva related transmembrane protein
VLADYADAIGLVAAALTTGSFFPQVVRTWRRGGADLSYAMLAVFLVGSGVWLAFGLITASAPVVVANALTALQVLAILVLKRARRSRTPDAVVRPDGPATA